jgi:hypothetical protein
MHIDQLAIVQITLSESLLKDNSAILDYGEGDPGNVEFLPRLIHVRCEINVGRLICSFIGFMCARSSRPLRAARSHDGYATNQR